MMKATKKFLLTNFLKSKLTLLNLKENF